MIDKQDEQKERPRLLRCRREPLGHLLPGGPLTAMITTHVPRSETHAIRRDVLISEQGMVEEETMSLTDPGNRYVFKTGGLAGEL